MVEVEHRRTIWRREVQDTDIPNRECLSPRKFEVDGHGTANHAESKRETAAWRRTRDSQAVSEGARSRCVILVFSQYLSVSSSLIEWAERMLGMTEKPASIVRRQLQQAGYEDVDDLQDQEDIQFLMKFVYKSNVIGPVVSFSYIPSTHTTINHQRADSLLIG